MSNMWNPYCFVNITSEKRVIDSDKRYTDSHKKGQEIEKKEGLNSGDGFKLGISMEVVEVEPEVTPEELLEQAKLEAQQIISEAKSHADALKYDAVVGAQKVYEEQTKAGYLKGLSDGQAKAQAELNALKAQLYGDIQKQAEALEAEYERKKCTMESEIVDAMIQVFHKVFHVQFEDKKEILLHLINNTLMNVDTGKSFRIRVSNTNRKFFEMHLPEIKERIGNDISIEVVNDIGLTEEGCIIETDGGVFNCGIDMQLSNLEKDIKSLCV